MNRIRLPFAAALLAAICALPAMAATTTFSGGNVGNCSYDAPSKSYTCSQLPLSVWNDQVTIASGYSVKVTNSVSFGYNQGLVMSGTARLESTGNLNIGDIRPENFSITGGTLIAGGTMSMGAQQQTITANITAANLDVNSGVSKITGSVTVTGQATFPNNIVVTGPVSAGTLTAGADGKYNAGITATNKITLNSRIVVSGNLSAPVIVTNSDVKVTGDVTATTSIALGSGVNVTGNVNAPTVTTDSPLTVKGNITTTTPFTLASHSNVTGNITAPSFNSGSPITVAGNITATSGNVTVASGSTINGNISGYNVTFQASATQVYGNVSANNIMILGSQTGIHGNITAHYAELQSSNTFVTGTATVDSIKMGTQTEIRTYITCQGSNTCSCLDNKSGYDTNTPTKTQCGGSVVAALHHFELAYSGNTGLTCAPKAITSVKACADAACSTTYNALSSVTLQPGAVAVALNNGVGSGTVQHPAPGTTTLGVSSPGVTPSSALVCNGGSNCQVTWQLKGLQMQIAPRRAGDPAAMTVQALEADASAPAVCKQALAGSQPIRFSCRYADPATGDGKITIGGSALQCDGSATADLNLSFSGSSANTTMSYEDAGKVELSAAYGIPNTNSAMTGSQIFTVAPYSFKFFAKTDKPGGDPDDFPYEYAKVGATGWARVGAINMQGKLTKNFGKEGTPSKASLSYSFTPPTNGEAGTLAFAPALVSFNGGLADVKALWDQVGLPQFKATLPNNDGYQGTALKVEGLQDARFNPAKFAAVLTDTDGRAPYFRRMACTAALTAAVPACAYYAFAGQQFELSVQALDAGGNVMKNYHTGFAKPVRVFTTATRGGAAVAELTVAQDASVFTNGVAVLGTSVSMAAEAAPQKVFLRAENVDASTLLASSPPNSADAMIVTVWGRAKVSNNYGAPTMALPLELQAHYFLNGQYVLSDLTTKDNAPAATASNLPYDAPYGVLPLSAALVQFENCSGSLVDNNGCTASVGLAANQALTFSHGKARFYLKAPGVKGSAGVRATGLQFLNGLDGKPGAATFGVYKSGPVIHLREVY